MIEKGKIEEVKKRDFFKIVNHYHDYDSVSTNLVMGNWPEKDVLLTVIIPVYNHPLDFFIRALNSALDQNVNFSYMVLVIDDFADNELNNGVEEYLCNHSDKRVVYYKNEKNLGVFANWNRGIMLARSKWITILHTDDCFRPNFLRNMFRVIKRYPEIDQLACPYHMLDYTKGNVDETEALRSKKGKAFLRKVDYREYMYEMFTSVKGAVYTKESLLKIGGFMNQGDGLGLDDYPLMMRYAYYFNTFWLDMDLYIDSWGYNDSINPKHWYPELIANYYMWKCMEKKRIPFIRWAYQLKDIYNLKRRAYEFKDGTSWVGVKIDIDFKELYEVCNVPQWPPVMELITFFARVIVLLDQKRIKLLRKRKCIYISE